MRTEFSTDKPPTLSAVVVVPVQILRGLRYLHKEKSIVHRDLTPNNIMLGENDKVTISKCHHRDHGEQISILFCSFNHRT